MTLVLVAVGTLLAACVQATGGIGFALILTPVLFALLPAVGAIVVATGLGLLLNALVLFAEHRRPAVEWKEVVPILVAAAPGTVVGLLVLRALPKPVLQVAVGIAVIGFGLVVLRGRLRVPAGQGWVRVPLGFTTGVLTTSTGVNGPPVALWLSSRGLRAHAVRDSLGAMFLGLGDHRRADPAARPERSAPRGMDADRGGARRARRTCHRQPAVCQVVAQALRRAAAGDHLGHRRHERRARAQLTLSEAGTPRTRAGPRRGGRRGRARHRDPRPK
ncbi:MAG: sulfite exporter TauE/SafE family protein [Solirubrobacteraceae bacterium]